MKPEDEFTVEYDLDPLVELAGIPWLDPLPVTVPGVGGGLACRLCAAKYGLSARDVGRLRQTVEEHEEHLRQFHAELLRTLAGEAPEGPG